MKRMKRKLKKRRTEPPARRSAPPVRAKRVRTTGAGKRAEKSAGRRDAILKAALDEFASRGFEGARLDDVAKRAGVAKGTIYLHFRDKEELFQELVRSTLSPFVEMIEAVQTIDLPLRVIVDRLAGAFVREVLGTRRKDIIRLVLTEGPRFPKVAEFYYREVPERAFTAVRRIIKKAIDRGEIADDTLFWFPQLLIAPGLVAILWDGLFDKYERLDAEAMLRAHFNLLLNAIERRTP
jgi:AcrR family transcriptional regulator